MQFNKYFSINIWALLIAIVVSGMTACGIENNAGTSPSSSNDTAQQSFNDESFAHGLYITKEESYSESDISSVEIISADEYYEEISEVVSETKVENALGMQSEAEINTEFISRGFTQFPICAEYSLEGDYLGEHEIEGNVSTKRPMYTTSYVAENDDLWAITSINGSITATPVTYNFQSTLNAKLIFSESETIECYDCYTGKFYTTIPNEDTLIVKVIDSINAETLEKLTIEEINKLCEGINQ